MIQMECLLYSSILLATAVNVAVWTDSPHSATLNAAVCLDRHYEVYCCETHHEHTEESQGA
jgi:hypothetical protein